MTWCTLGDVSITDKHSTRDLEVLSSCLRLGYLSPYCKLMDSRLQRQQLPLQFIKTTVRSKASETMEPGLCSLHTNVPTSHLKEAAGGHRQGKGRHVTLLVGQCWPRKKYLFFLDKLRRAKRDCEVQEQKMLSGKSINLKPQRRQICRQSLEGGLGSRKDFTAGKRKIWLLRTGNGHKKITHRGAGQSYQLGRWIEKPITKNLMWSTRDNFSSQCRQVLLMENGMVHTQTYNSVIFLQVSTVSLLEGVIYEDQNLLFSSSSRGCKVHVQVKRFGNGFLAAS